jgi:translation elongation factor EF-Tu-like GTPase
MISEIVGYYYNQKSNTLQVTFRLKEDSEDYVREDEFEIDYIENSGYYLLEDYDYESSDYPIIYEEDTDELIIDEEVHDEKDYKVDTVELKSFLQEYYETNPKKLPNSNLF